MLTLGPLRWGFPPSTDSPLRARRLVTGWLGDHDRVSGTVPLLVSEVVTNVVRHTGGPGELRLHHDGRVLRVEVEDGSDRLPRIAPEPDGGGGFGLRLVDALASRWGYEPTAAGKVVWFEVEVPVPQLSGRASATGRDPQGPLGA